MTATDGGNRITRGRFLKAGIASAAGLGLLGAGCGGGEALGGLDERLREIVEQS